MQTDVPTGKPVLLYPEGALILNRTAEVIIRLCDGTLKTDEIAAKMSQQFRAESVEQLRRDVSRYLDALRARNLLEFVPTPEVPL